MDIMVMATVQGEEDVSSNPNRWRGFSYTIHGVHRHVPTSVFFKLCTVT
jgi:hypothetical protein